MKKLCPNCEELLKPTSNPEVGQCAGCGWSGHYWRAAKEPALPTVTPKMPYVSIDIETTGLDPETCQILEIGAVYDDWTKPIDQLPKYHRLVVHKEYRGGAYALALNANLLKQLSGQREAWFLDPWRLAHPRAADCCPCPATRQAGRNHTRADLGPGTAGHSSVCRDADHHRDRPTTLRLLYRRVPSRRV